MTRSGSVKYKGRARGSIWAVEKLISQTAFNLSLHCDHLAKRTDWSSIGTARNTAVSVGWHFQNRKQWKRMVRNTVRPCQVKVQSASWHCCSQVGPFSVFSKMPHPGVSACSSIRRTLQNCRIWTCGFFFLLSARPRAQEDSFKVERHSGRQEGRGEAPVHERGSRRRQSHCRWPDCSWGREERQKPLRMTRLLLGSWGSERCTWRSTACCENQ